MAGSSITKRVIFLRGKQKEFLLNTKRILNLSYIELAKLLEISKRTLTDWKREKFSMTLKAVKMLTRKTNKEMPEHIEIKDSFWHVNKAAKLGGAAVYKKYGRIGGNPKIRKQKWYEWWEREGKYKSNLITSRRIIKKPKYSQKLAEFTGIMLGDGGISKFQTSITLHYKDDKEYGKFVVALIKKLFDVSVGKYYDKKGSVVRFSVSRRELVDFCVKELGLKQGNKIKQQIDIPNWVKQNKLYSITCLRGLVDTDGCIFTHHYKSNNKSYSYKKLSFTSYSKPLRRSVYNILKANGMKPRLSQDKDVRLDSVKDMQMYFQFIGSHNPKHLKRYFK
jgi:hypothetical protein